MIQFKYYNEGATFDASSLNNDDIAFVEDENALYTHGKKFKFVDEVTPSPTLPVEGAAQIFADQECTRYADGSTEDVYVRVNRNFGFGDIKDWGSYETAGSSLEIGTPTQEDPDWSYDIRVWVDWYSGSLEGPIEAGTVIRCHAPSAGVENPQVIFYDE